MGMIRRNIKYKKKEIIVKLYKALVRPRLEYCVQAWSPYLIKDINLLEKVQRRATKMIEGFSKLSYEERLLETGLTTLSERRLRGDIVASHPLVKSVVRHGVGRDGLVLVTFAYHPSSSPEGLT